MSHHHVGTSHEMSDVLLNLLKCFMMLFIPFNYVLSTMGVSKESISKFLIGNRFHVKLRILSPENCKQRLRVKR